MPKVNVNQINIPIEVVCGWQTIANLLTELVSVPAAMIVRAHKQHLEIFCCSDGSPREFQVGDTHNLGTGLYCEHVISQRTTLKIANARDDLYWRQTPLEQEGYIAYLGIPIRWPTGDIFGTLCLLDTSPNNFDTTFQNLMESFRDAIESQMTTLYQKEQLTAVNQELSNRVQTRTKDLVELNYSLNQEIGKRIAAEEKVRYQNHHDSGTGFLNRPGLEQSLQSFLDHKKPECAILVFYIGFANGATLQSKHGYVAWEQILIHFRQRLNNLSHLDFITARPASNDLVIAVTVATNQLNSLTEEVCRHVINVSQSEFELEGQRIHLHAYIGITTSEMSDNPMQMLKQAQEAMRSCKDLGHKFNHHSQALADFQQELNHLESYLLKALRNEDLLLYFQPKVSPTTKQWIGAEALLRWRHPVLGDFSNESLIHIAERNGLIFEVGTFVLHSAFKKSAPWINSRPNFKISVNVSAVQLRNPQFAEHVESILKQHQFPAKNLELEITESSLIADEHAAHSTLTALHTLGVTLSLDDFGTGYATFNYLKKYPFDALKIDKSFIQHLDSSDNDREIVHSIIYVAKKLNLAVTVEGIESAFHENFIIQEGCEYGQGFYYGKPMTAEQFEYSLLNQIQHQSAPPMVES
ncbi:bifunctional diguanylate cyclase/phosphodiesterase [Vibrio olivae]|uniref:EAL domain-containing protein n=1 Tax=Vibrio olivae TaxID=1243002 RepID=A0ABV5HSI3_9VIBR